MIHVGDEFYVRVKVTHCDQDGGAESFRITPTLQPGTSCWVAPETLEDSKPAKAEPVHGLSKDDVLRLLLKRIAIHAGDHTDMPLAMDYGRIEELCWLVRAVMGERFNGE